MRKVIFIALSLLSVVGYGQGIKISALPQAGSLTGSELTPVVQNGITKKTTVQSIANLGGGGSGWSLTGNAGTNPDSNFIGTTDAKDFVTKTNGIERFRIDTNGYILLGNRILSIRDSVNPKNIININDADLAFQVGSVTDSFQSSVSIFNTTIENSITSQSTGLGVGHNIDSTSSSDRVSYNGLDFQQGVYDNEGTKGNITTEMNIFSPSLDRDIAYLGMHYGHWEYFISDTSSGGSELPQGHGVFGLDSLAFATHVTEKPTSEYASKFATKFLADTAFKFMIDSNETPIFSVHRNGVKIVDGTQGSGKVLTSNAYGLANWQTLALTDTATLDFGNISANGHQVLTMTVTGAALSDVVSLGIPNASMNDHASFVTWVSSANTVSVKCFNFDGSSFNPAAGLFTVKVFK